ncbi:hypothetical protein GCM10010182_16340 [Actinomadura cremea]|nr:hypothetical protein GCM10010182_16340 [Actinomadura cremea]
MDDRLAAIDDLLARPFPEGAHGHVHVLHATRDFWDDRGEEVVEAAQAEIDAVHDPLVAALTRRWGEPEPFDLTPYLWAEDPAPEPIDRLCALTTRMLLWRPTPARWLGLAVCQADAEFPLELHAAVGGTPIPGHSSGRTLPA